MMPGNPVVGGVTLRRAAIQSPNFVQSPLTGWAINADGTAYFAGVTITGSFMGTNFIIGSSGAFFYSGTPAAGNMVTSITNGTGTDSHGNSYLAGVTSYTNVAAGEWLAANMNSGVFGIFTATSEAGPWSSQGSFGYDFVSGSLQITGFLEVLDTSTFESAVQFSNGITVGNGVTGNSIQMNPARVAPGTSSGTSLAVTQSHLDQLVGELQAYGLLA